MLAAIPERENLSTQARPRLSFACFILPLAY
jgi:hypothetical protein